MAAARSSKKSPITGRDASRLSFAKITDTLTVPDLLALQTESFDWLVGNDVWKERVVAAKAAGDTGVPETTGLDEIFEERAAAKENNLREAIRLQFVVGSGICPNTLSSRPQYDGESGSGRKDQL